MSETIANVLKIKSVSEPVDGNVKITFEDGEPIDMIFALAENLPEGVQAGGYLTIYLDGSASFSNTNGSV